MNDAGLEREALAWMDDPYGHFGMSTTKIHSISPKEAEPVLLAALNLRLDQRRQQIPVLAKLADAQGIGTVATLDDAAPLLFTHETYKSYPISLLAKQRFAQLNTWLGRLTPYDVSGVDVSDCDSIDGWLTRLQTETPLDVATSSGSSGTLSLFPKSKKDYAFAVTGLRVQLGQKFGVEPTDDEIHGKIHALTPMYRDGHSSAGRFAQYLLSVFCQGDEAYLHTALPFKVSSDLMWLAARIRAAVAKGDATKVDVPDNLLARRGEWETLQRDLPSIQSVFIRREVQALRGQRIFAMGTTAMFYAIAKQGLAEGVRGAFAPGSVLMGGGGAKGMVLPDDAEQTIKDFFGIDWMQSAYGMTELNAFSVLCEAERYHLAPWVAPFILDGETGQPLPREGVQTGRAAFFDVTHDGTWGGVVTGDQVTAHYDACLCGRRSLSFAKKIQRFSEAAGGDDKITCAATPSAQNKALDFLNALEG
ncbi:hypothetical protein LJR225_002774 [Phenylobacterium sp. LjRoot225]|uniref:hypothetical protein n=1 Tax=Phenylobacterium sp. LjRoot225 TaxID=3342285 RepID=UPI003ECF4B19